MNKAPWIEKYRPKTISSIAGQDIVKKLMLNCIRTNSSANLVFEGPPGSGKTSTVDSLINDMYGKSNAMIMTMRLDASMERGIDKIREKIIPFSNTKSINIINRDKCIPKTIVLDECDSMTQDAQSILRNNMEHEKNNVISILICNQANKICPSISSRCTTIKFKSLTIDNIFSRLRYIAECENLIVNDNVLMEIAKISNGDLRVSINNLESISYYKDLTKIDIRSHLCHIEDKKILEYLLDKNNSIRDKCNEFEYILDKNSTSLVTIMHSILDMLIIEYENKFKLDGIITLIEDFARYEEQINQELSETIVVTSIVASIEILISE